MSLRTVALAGAAGLLSVGAAAAPASAVPIIQQPFHADSGDKCPMGFTTGTFGWQIGSPGTARLVTVTGTVVDRPLPGDPATVCGEDARNSTATFTAYNKGVPVHNEAHTVNNGRLSFTTTLTAVPPIDRIVVQVCRRSLQPTPPDFCGIPQQYTPPNTTANAG